MDWQQIQMYSTEFGNQSHDIFMTIKNVFGDFYLPAEQTKISSVELFKR